jgi:hypothetical protein
VNVSRLLPATASQVGIQLWADNKLTANRMLDGESIGEGQVIFMTDLLVGPADPVDAIENLLLNDGQPVSATLSLVSMVTHLEAPARAAHFAAYSENDSISWRTHWLIVEPGASSLFMLHGVERDETQSGELALDSIIDTIEWPEMRLLAHDNGILLPGLETPGVLG